MNSLLRQAARPSLPVPENVKLWFERPLGSERTLPHYVREWLGEVVQSNYRLLYSIAYGYLPNPAIAEDMVQSAVLSGLQKLRQLRQPEVVVAWLAAIVRNHCLSARRGEVRSVPIDDYREDVFGGAEEQRFEEQRLLTAALNKLPETLASVVRLRFLEDCDILEIALRLGLRRNTVEVRLHRALKLLAENPALQALKGGER